MIPDQTKQLAHRLRLFGIHAHLERRASEALASQMHPLEFLRLLLEDEALFRKDRVAKILATRARFRSSAEIDDWDGTYDRGIPKAKLKELASLTFFLNQESLLLLGKTGEGKSHLAVALGRRCAPRASRRRSCPSICSIRNDKGLIPTSLATTSHAKAAGWVVIVKDRNIPSARDAVRGQVPRDRKS